MKIIYLGLFWCSLDLLGIVEPLEVIIPAQKVFRFAFSPGMFDWRGGGGGGELESRGTKVSSRISYDPSLRGKPDLPEWIHYTYSSAMNQGFIYGVPPPGDNAFVLEVVARNHATYALGILLLTLNITETQGFQPPSNAVHLKIDNLDESDIFSGHRLRNLLSIFKTLLWRESGDDLHLASIASSLHHGYRRPLNPNHKNGIILKLGSNADFSDELLKLDRETGPLRRKFRICPQRDFHRTSAERHFRFEGFALDWCAFRLLTLENDEHIATYRTFGVMEAPDKEAQGNPRRPFHERDPGSYNPGPFKPSSVVVPSKSYIAETDTPSVYLTALFGTLLAFIAMCSLIAIIVCFDVSPSGRGREENEETSGEGFIESFFLVLSDCFKCYKDSEDDESSQLKPNNTLSETPQEHFGSEVLQPRSRRASSIQRQTDSLRRSALRKHQGTSCSPSGTLERFTSDEEEYLSKVATPPSELFEERPYPPPYFYEAGQMSESKSYLV